MVCLIVVIHNFSHIKIQSKQTYQFFLEKETGFNEETYYLFPAQPTIITKVTVAESLQSQQLAIKISLNLVLKSCFRGQVKQYR